ncbi:MAG: hypothetical protein K7J46_02420 [Bryobacter sp.]|jgi:hypothetical protein|nr:hypothetical protein [Bryobacter sp. CoA8 C33]
MFDLVHASQPIWIAYASLLGLALAPGIYWIQDEAARILYVSVFCSIAYLPYLFALYSARHFTPGAAHWRIAWLTALGLRLLCFFPPALFSDDVLRYEWEARTMLSGLNPYLTTPREMAAINLRIPGYDFAAVYGPWLEAVHALVFAAGLPLKASGAAAELLLLVLVARQGMAFERWLLLAWSPLSIVEFWLNGHNDAWLILFLYLGLWSVGLVSWGFLAMAVLTKWWPALLMPVWWARAYSLPGMAAFAALLIPCAFLMPVEAWLTKIRFASGFLGGWQNNAFLYRFLSDKWQSFTVSLLAGMLLPLTRLDRDHLTLWFVTIFLAFSGNIHPWYLTWLLPGLLRTKVNPLPWLVPMALLPLAYNPMLGWVAGGYWRPDERIPLFIWSGTGAFAIYSFLKWWKAIR